MRRIWQLQEAKNKFSSVVEQAQNEGPQIISKHGKEAVIILSIEEYRKIMKPEGNLFQFMQKSPFHGVELDISRDKTTPRNISL